jgi:Concanavalin A-like lectin/glucanases superfamily
MSRVFNGSNAYVIATTVHNLGLQYSFGGWIEPAAANGGAILAAFPHGSYGQVTLTINPAGRVELRARWNAADGVWESPVLAPLTKWRWVGVTYDYSGSAAIKPTLFLWDGGALSVLTVGAGLTETQAPSGVQIFENSQLVFGNGLNFALPLAGKLGHLFFYTRVLTENEMRSLLFRGVRTIATPHIYLTLDQGLLTNYGDSGLVFAEANTVVAEIPPVRRLSGPMMMVG